mmetsp:Transcript_35712/g.80729  ORF Transcript_35712/g.80729 Transcript_35712/m.80729 type:complete len:282 (+) Transcript_35712:181-1026(+)
MGVVNGAQDIGPTRERRVAHHRQVALLGPSYDVFLPLPGPLIAGMVDVVLYLQVDWGHSGESQDALYARGIVVTEAQSPYQAQGVQLLQGFPSSLLLRWVTDIPVQHVQVQVLDTKVPQLPLQEARCGLLAVVLNKADLRCQEELLTGHAACSKATAHGLLGAVALCAIEVAVADLARRDLHCALHGRGRHMEDARAHPQEWHPEAATCPAQFHGPGPRLPWLWVRRQQLRGTRWHGQKKCRAVCTVEAVRPVFGEETGQERQRCPQPCVGIPAQCRLGLG